MLCADLPGEQRAPEYVLACDAMEALAADEEAPQAACVQEGEDGENLVVPDGGEQSASAGVQPPQSARAAPRPVTPEFAL